MYQGFVQCATIKLETNQFIKTGLIDFRKNWKMEKSKMVIYIEILWHNFIKKLGFGGRNSFENELSIRRKYKERS